MQTGDAVATLVDHAAPPKLIGNSDMEVFRKNARRRAKAAGLGRRRRVGPKKLVTTTTFRRDNTLPVATAFRRQDLIDNRHPCFAGVVGLGINPKLKNRLDDTDLLCSVAAHNGEIVSGGYTYFTFPKPKQTMVHIAAGVDEIDKVYQADLGINAGMAEFCAAATDLPPVDLPWSGETKAAHEDYVAFLCRRRCQVM